ncbi:hypothetical protein FRX31_035337 [Thalictrum thalictroides]|uniref:Uncharacterized protein n=1 Tax=Thalictrum thalictroides TaxID=46969 RepID=A0A7J6URC3_THATH|nr:hypothetical protein FRX31_035337 [Thalictrum thalictroides]
MRSYAKNDKNTIRDVAAAGYILIKALRLSRACLLIVGDGPDIYVISLGGFLHCRNGAMAGSGVGVIKPGTVNFRKDMSRRYARAQVAKAVKTAVENCTTCGDPKFGLRIHGKVEEGGFVLEPCELEDSQVELAIRLENK